MRARSPKGGITIDGRFYRGGCFLPATSTPADGFAARLATLKLGEELRGSPWLWAVLTHLPETHQGFNIFPGTPFQERYDRLKAGDLFGPEMDKLLGLDHFATDYGTMTQEQFRRLLPLLKFTSFHECRYSHGSKEREAELQKRTGWITDDVITRATAPVKPAKPMPVPSAARSTYRLAPAVKLPGIGKKATAKKAATKKRK